MVISTLTVRGGNQALTQVQMSVVTSQVALSVQASLRATPNSGMSAVTVDPATLSVTGPTQGPSTSTGNQAAGNGAASTTSSGGLTVGALVGIVAAIFVVALAIGCFVYQSGGRGGKKEAGAHEHDGRFGQYYSNKSNDFGGVSPAFTPHIARGQTSQRYSGSGAPGSGRRSFGNNNVEMSIYSAGYGDSSVASSQNPHFNSPRLNRQSLDGRRSSSGRQSFSR